MIVFSEKVRIWLVSHSIARLMAKFYTDEDDHSLKVSLYQCSYEHSTNKTDNNCVNYLVDNLATNAVAQPWMLSLNDILSAQRYFDEEQSAQLSGIWPRHRAAVIN